MARGQEPTLPVDASALGERTVGRGQDSVAYENVVLATNAAQQPYLLTNRWTLLENCISYLDANGVWQPSEDVITSAPGGAVALRGPNKAIFSYDLAIPPAWDIQSADGHRLRGGVRSVRVTDPISGQSQVLGTVKTSAPGRLVPPNMLVYENCFDGLDADVVLIWRHNAFSQNVILKQQPVLPAGISGDTARLEVVSELLEAPDPARHQRRVPQPGSADLVDDLTLGFGSLVAIVGKTFPVNGATPALSLAGGPLAQNGVDVMKQWAKSATGGGTLVESMGWKEIQPFLQALPTSQRAAKATGRSASGGERASGSDPAKALGGRDATAAPEKAPSPAASQRASRENLPSIQLASGPYEPTGLLVDFDLSGSANSFTFTNGATYYVQYSFAVGGSGGTATFQNNCVVKYLGNAYLTAYGPVSFPSSPSGGPCLFTSLNDDSVGDTIFGSTGQPTASTGANPELSVYYCTTNVTVRNAFFRWAQAGLAFASGGGPSYYVQNTSFKDCTVGIRNNTCYQLSLQSAVTYCDVPTPITGGYNCYSGSMSQVCQTDLYFNADTNAPYSGQMGSAANPYPGGGQGPSGLYFDQYLNLALSNRLTETNYPPCTRLVVHLMAAANTNFTDGIRLPSKAHQYYTGGLTFQGAGTNSTVLMLKPNASVFADKKVVEVYWADVNSNPEFFYAPFTISDMTIDCNWSGQGIYTQDGHGSYKNGAVLMPATYVTIQRLTVRNFGANGLDITPTNDPGAEAFPIWAATANLGQPSTPITVQNCEVTGFTSVHGGYASCILVQAHWPQDRVPGDAFAWSTNITAALVQSNWIYNAQGTIALNTVTSSNALTTEQVVFTNNYCDGIGQGFNSDYNGARHVTIANNTFANCYQGINLGGGNWGCGNYSGWNNFTISGNKFMFLGQPSNTCYYTFYTTQSAPCPANPTICGIGYTNSQYGTTLWYDCFAVRLAGACDGSTITISNNACTTVPHERWANPGGSYTYYVVQVLSDSYVTPGLGKGCGRANLNPNCSNNTTVQSGSSYAYCYSPNEPADDVNTTHVCAYSCSSCCP